MDYYAKLALVRVDELEQRLRTIAGKRTTQDGFEFQKKSVGAYCSSETFEKTLATFVAAKGKHIQIETRFCGEFFVESTVSVCLLVDEESVFEGTKTEDGEFDWSFSKSVRIFDEEPKTIKLVVSSKSPMRMLLDYFSLSVLGEIVEAPEESFGVSVSADGFGFVESESDSATGEDASAAKIFDAKEESHMLSNTALFAFTTASAGALGSAAFHRIHGGVIESTALLGSQQTPSETPQEDPEEPEDPLLLEDGQKFAISKVACGQLFLREFLGGERIAKDGFELVCDADSAAVAYSSFGELFVGRMVDGLVQIKNQTKNSAWTNVAEGTTGFDIVGAPHGARGDLLVVFAKEGKVYVAQCERGTVLGQFQVETETSVAAKKVAFARGFGTSKQIFVVADDRTVWAEEIVPEPNENVCEPCFLRSSCSLLVF